ncbi:MAG: DivIVA domain-containing protein [Oscillospiraceae bacterium]
MVKNMLTPENIKNKEFKKELRGYSTSEVNNFLQEISEEYENVYKENLAATDKISMLSEAVKQYKSMEETLENALAVAKGAGSEIRAKAYESAEGIMKEAEDKAKGMLTEAAAQVDHMNYKYEQIKQSVEIFRVNVIELLNSQLDTIKEYSNIQTDTYDEVKQPKVKVPKFSHEDNDEKDVENSKTIENIEKITQVLPKLVLNDDGEYVEEK